MARLREFYKDTVVPELVKQFGYKSVMEVPRIEKITLNMGVGEAVADKKVMEHAVSDLEKIAGQNQLLLLPVNLSQVLKSVITIQLVAK